MAQPLAVLNVLAVVVLVFALAMCAPLLLSVGLQDGALVAFAESVLATAACGLVIWIATSRCRRELQNRDGFLLVALGWAGLPAFAALPLLLYLPRLTFTRAYFEAVSGLTTTGATVLVGLDHLPPSLNLWRCQLQWMGGMGIIVLAVAILPLLGVGGSQLFRAETPGPMKDTKLTPRITETAKGLWTVYALMTAACALALYFAGMNVLDAVMHAFTTMSLGGLSSHDASYAYWNSPAIEAVTVLFMLIAGMNFATHFLALRRLAVRPYREDPEIGWYLAVMLASVLAIAVFLRAKGIYGDFATALRYAGFNVVSIATTTGFVNTDYGRWPVFAPLWMLLLATFATCSGSTGAGIKMVRAEVMARQAFREILQILHPRAYLPIRIGGRVVEHRVIAAIFAFMLVYGVTVIVLTMVLTASGLSFLTALSAILACINNTGPGVNEVGPASNYLVLGDFQTWVCAAAMLLGRLELISFLVVFTPAFWRK